MKRVAVIGLGDIAKVHLPILRAMPEVDLCAVCDTDAAKSALADGTPFYTEVNRVLQDVKPDAVHLCLPHDLHYPMAEAAAKAGVHVFCEKPLARELAEAARFVELERAYPALRFGLCLQNRYNKSSVKLREIIESGAEGAVKGIKGLVSWNRPKAYYEAQPWRGLMARAGGGVMINQSIHTLDLMQWFGGEMQALRGTVCSLLDYGIEVEDTATASITFANGAKGFFMATIANSKNDNVEIAVTLEKAEYLIADNALYKRDENGARILVCEDDRLPGTKFYYGASHATAIAAYYAAFEAGTQNYIHAREGYRCMQMIDAIRTSASHTVLL